MVSCRFLQIDRCSSIRVARPCYQRSGMLPMTPVIGKRWCRSHGRGLEGVDGWKSVGTPMCCRSLKHFECFRQPMFVSVRNMFVTILMCFLFRWTLKYHIYLMLILFSWSENHRESQRYQIEQAGQLLLDPAWMTLSHEWANADRWYLLYLLPLGNLITFKYNNGALPICRWFTYWTHSKQSRRKPWNKNQELCHVPWLC